MRCRKLEPAVISSRSAEATVPSTAAGSETGASSHRWTPSGNRADRSGEVEGQPGLADAARAGERQQADGGERPGGASSSSSRPTKELPGSPSTAGAGRRSSARIARSVVPQVG